MMRWRIDGCPTIPRLTCCTAAAAGAPPMHAVGLNTSYIPLGATGPLQLPPSAVGPLFVQQQQVVLQGDVPGNAAGAAAPASVEVSVVGCTFSACTHMQLTASAPH